MNKTYYEYEHMISDLNSIYRQMAKDSWKPDVILGIARGGLIPAVHASHWWDVPLMTCHVSLRDHKKTDLPSEIWRYLERKQNILVIDDICDSGETLEYLAGYYLSNTLEYLPGYCLSNIGIGTEFESEKQEAMSHLKTAVLIHNEGQKLFDPNYYGTLINKVENPTWIVYPWEE